MVEYTREILNSKCDLTMFKKSIDKIVNEIINAISNKRVSNNFIINDKRLIYEIKPITIWNHNYQLNDNNNELSTEIIRQVIIELKKNFTDSNIYNKIKTIEDIYDNITIHNVIVVDWN